MPTQRELLTVVHAGTQNPTIDSTYFPNTVWSNTPFPNTVGSNFWSGSSYAPDPSWAGAVYFNFGYTNADAKSSGGYVRLVHGGQF